MVSAHINPGFTSQNSAQDYLRAHYADQIKHGVDISELEDILLEHVTESDFTYESIDREVQTAEKTGHILQLMHEEGYTAKEVASKSA